MGNKSNATGLRIGINKNWQATWYVNKHNFGDTLINDIKIRDHVEMKLKNAGVARIVIKRAANKVIIDVHVARPGVVIGRGGAGIQELNNELKDIAKADAEVKVFEVKNPEASAKYISEEIGKQISNRVVPKMAASRMMKAAIDTHAVKGISMWISGRIKGAEIARTEKFEWGSVPRHTLRADIDYHFSEVIVPGAGRHGIKVWVYKGEKSNFDEN